MARPRRRAASPTRCQRKINGRRCVREGAGNPVLCRACREDLLRELAAQQNPAADVIHRMANGERVPTGDIIAGLFGLAGAFLRGEPIGQQQQPRPNGTGIPGVHFPWDTGAPAPGFNNPPPPRPPPPDPRVAAKKKLELEARKAFGFSPTEPLTPDVIKKRYRELARKHHPDRKGGSAERMKTINTAYEILDIARPST